MRYFCKQHALNVGEGSEQIGKKRNKGRNIGHKGGRSQKENEDTSEEQKTQEMNDILDSLM